MTGGARSLRREPEIRAVRLADQLRSCWYAMARGSGPQCGYRRQLGAPGGFRDIAAAGLRSLQGGRRTAAVEEVEHETRGKGRIDHGWWRRDRPCLRRFVRPGRRHVVIAERDVATRKRPASAPFWPRTLILRRRNDHPISLRRAVFLHGPRLGRCVLPEPTSPATTSRPVCTAAIQAFPCTSPRRGWRSESIRRWRGLPADRAKPL